MERLGSDYLSASIKSAIVASIEEEMRINRIPGVSVAIVFDQDLICDMGFGYSDAESRTAVNSDTIFAVGSVTKLITATMLMQLRDAGKLNLDDPVQKYLPSLKIRSPGNEGRPVTLRQIASHTAGLPRELSFESWNTLEFPPVDKLLDELKDVTPVFPPLSRYKYSNLGYTILGQVLSVVAGVPYKQYAWENILRPLGMTSSGFALEDLPGQPATGYTVSGASPVEKAPYLNFGALAPSVQLFSTAKDMSRFISLQFQEDSGTPTDFAKNAIALHPSTIREMHSPVYVGKRWVGGTAIGWHISRALGQTISSHRGGIPGFTADIALIRELKFGVGVFTNAFPQPNEIAVRILEMLTPILASANTDSAQAEPGEEDAIGYEKYTGRYKSKYFGEVEIRIARGRLVMSDPLAPPGLEAILIPAGENRFVMSGGDEDGEFAVFDVTADGRVKSVNTAGYRYDR
jgi:CubicO group peptidase (beta-lactamase class C family)